MAVTTFKDIKRMSADFKAMLNTNRAGMPFDVDNSALIVLVDVGKNLNAILSRNPAKLAIAIGLEKNKLTLCLLGADANGKPMKRSTGGLSATADEEEDDGQETWPDEEEITNSENEEYDQFFLP